MISILTSEDLSAYETRLRNIEDFCSRIGAAMLSGSLPVLGRAVLAANGAEGDVESLFSIEAGERAIVCGVVVIPHGSSYGPVRVDYDVHGSFTKNGALTYSVNSVSSNAAAMLGCPSVLVTEPNIDPTESSSPILVLGAGGFQSRLVTRTSQEVSLEQIAYGFRLPAAA